MGKVSVVFAQPSSHDIAEKVEIKDKVEMMASTPEFHAGCEADGHARKQLEAIAKALAFCHNRAKAYIGGYEFNRGTFEFPAGNDISMLVHYEARATIYVTGQRVF